MLESRGVQLVALERRNDDLDESKLRAKTAMAANTI